MHRFVQLACLLGMATGMVLPACGGATKNDEQFSSGLPPSDGLSGLNQTDQARLCNSVNGFVRDNGHSFCRFSALLAAGANVEFDVTATDESIRQVCATTLTTCERGIAGDGGAPTCRSVAFGSPCTATIGEYESCLSEEFGALNQAIAMAPDCSSLTAAYLRPGSSDDTPISDKLVLTNGAACKTFKSHCPGAFSSDAVGGSTTTTGSSSKGPAESPDGGGFGGRCGNGIVEPGEDCDGPNVNDQTCATATMAAFTAGTLRCTSSCRFDLSGCMQASP